MDNGSKKSNASNVFSGLAPFAAMTVPIVLFVLVYHQRVSFDGFWEFYPFRIFALKSLLSGTLPDWMPNIYNGFPVWAEGQAGVTYPLNLLVSGPASYLAYPILALFLTGLFTYFYFRNLGISSLAASVALLPCVLGPASVYLFGNPNSLHVIALFPLGLWMIELSIEKRRAYAFVLLGFVIGMIFLAGELMTAYFNCLVLAIYALVRWVAHRRSVRQKWTALVGLGFAGCIGIAIGAAQLLPLLELIANTISPHQETSIPGIGQEFYHKGAMTFSMLGHLLLPRAFDFDAMDEINFLPYLGMLPLLVIWAGKRSRTWGVLWVMTAITLLLAFGYNTPVYQWITELPGLSLLRKSARFTITTTYFLSALAAFGLDRIALQKQKAQTPILAMLLAMGLAVAAVVIGFHDKVQWAGQLNGNILAASLFLVLLSVLTLILLRRSSTHLTWVLIGLVVMTDLLAYGMWREKLEDETIFATALVTPTIEAKYMAHMGDADKRLVRIFPDFLTDGITRSDYLPSSDLDTAFGFHSFWGWEEPALRPKRIILAADAFLKGRIHVPYLTMCGARYIMTSLPIDTTGLEPLFRIDDMEFYKNDRALPLAFLAASPTYVQTIEQGIEIIGGADFDPRAVSVIESPPLNVMAGEFGAVEVQWKNAARYTMVLAPTMPRVLVFSQNFYPGWQASIDGVPVKIFPVNVQFMGVKVPAGSHVVEFTFKSKSLRTGLFSALFAMIFGVLAIAFLWRRRANREIQ
jgi:hypothetical protein